ncbi:hypothetical protein [Deinococcus sp. UYEF24]
MSQTAPTVSAQLLIHDQGYVISVYRSARIGLITEEERGTLVTTPTTDSVVRMVDALNARGIGKGLRARLLDPIGDDTVAARQAGVAVSSVWALLAEEITRSPVPDLEWPQARHLFADDAQLGNLLGVAPSSIMRYTRGERVPRDTQVVERLHALMIAADLGGTFNGLGVRRWYTRARTQLGGESPAQTLSGDWSLNTEACRRVRALADSDLNFQAS